MVAIGILSVCMLGVVSVISIVTLAGVIRKGGK